jgi:glycosyltransferase involved in cell wall biosynthesis
VERYSREIVRALQQLMADHASDAAALRIEIVLHRQPEDAPTGVALAETPGSALPGHVWEQSVLWWRQPHAVLLSLANSGPALRKNQLLVIHDAAIYDVPDAFTFAYRTWYRMLYRCVRHSGAKLATVSEFSRDRLAEHLQLSQEQIAVIPNGVDHIHRISSDTTILDRLGLRPHDYVLTLGSQAPHKNVSSLLQAVPGLAERGLKLVIAGGSNSKVFGVADIRDTSGHVVRTGRITDGEVRALMEGALTFAFPSLYEGFGIPPLEAMALGVPAAVTDRRPFTDLFAPAAWFLDKGDEIGSLLRYVDLLRDDPAYRQRRSEAGLALAGEYTWRRSAAALLSWLVGSSVGRGSA